MHGLTASLNGLHSTVSNVAESIARRGERDGCVASRAVLRPQDAGLVYTAQAVEHHEIALCHAQDLGDQLGYTDAVPLLEIATAQKLSHVAETAVNAKAG